MKVKELQKTVNVAWSPEQQNPIMLAAGTAAQQLDASATSVLEIYSANLLDPGYDFDLKASQTSQYKFHKVIWSPSGFGSTHPNGLIAGGCEGGNLQVYSAHKLLAGQDALIAHQNKHSGPIRGLDFNPFQNNLLASVASDSEIFVWDLNNTTTPMTPGTKTQPLEDVQSVAWNRQVQHILSSVFSTRCVIWDLRKNEQIMKLNDSQSRVRWRAVQWHPDIATQLWLASEDDQAPYVQLWDLRYATAPAKSMQIHSRGVLGLTWCPKDTDLMISCGKDNKIYCWNPNTDKAEGEILGEIATTIQWYSDVQWCPRNPALIASSSLEGSVSVYSLFGGTHQQVQTTNKIADSFPGMDQIAQAPIPQQTTQVVFSDLKRAPKWMKKKAGVSFGFGGRLITFNENSGKNISINQIITDPELIDRANALEKTLEEGNFLDYCKLKADQMNDQHGRYMWYFIKANFELNPREEMLNLLGYNKDDINCKFQKYVKNYDILNHDNLVNVTNKMANLTHSDSSEVEGDQSTDDSTDLSAGDNNALFEAIAAGNKTLSEVAEKKLNKYKIPTGTDKDGLICEAILSGNLEAAVEICMESDRSAEALIIASTAGIEFLTKTQNNYLNKQDNELSNLISALVANEWIDVMSQSSLSSWKEALVAALTHSDGQIGGLCAKLGERLQDESNDIQLARNSILCFICAGNLEKLVDTWLHLKNHNNTHSKLTTAELQELVEIVMLLKKSLELRGQHIEPTGKLAEFLSQYAGLLAGQGALDTALSYLGPTDDPELEDLRERLYYALGHKQVQQNRQLNQYGRNYYGNQSNTTTSSSSNRFNNQRNSFSNTLPNMQPTQPTQPILNNNFNSGISGQPQLFQSTLSGQQPWNVSSVQSVPTFNQMIPQQQQNNLIYNQGMSAPTSVAPPPPSAITKPPTINESLNYPQRPSSVGSQGSTGVPLTRSKYVVDPSVSTGPTYGQSMYNPAPTNLTGPPQQQLNLNALGNDIYQPQQQQSMMMQPHINPSNFKPFTPSQQNVGTYLTGIPPIETARDVMPPPPPLNKNPTPPPGWNDPPPLSSSARSHNNEMSAKHAGTRQWQKIINCKSINNSSSTLPPSSSSDIGKQSAVTKLISQDNIILQPKAEQQKINPITHPLFGIDPNHNQNGFIDPNLQFQNQSFGGGLMQSQMYQQQQQQQPPPQGIPLPPQSQQQILNPLSQTPQNQQINNQFIPNQNNFKTQAVPSNMYKDNQSNLNNETVSQKSIQPLKEKPPLPEEFIYLQTVFEELRNQCLNVATDARTKRKFADVAKRLESLYDALRDGRLSANTINALNQIVQYLQNGDYSNALATHTLIASGPDFSQTANFMPGIKILVQSASELKVYLR